MKYDYKIDTNLLPKVYITWWTADGTQHWLNCQTGKKMLNPDANTNSSIGITWRTMKQESITVKSGSNVKYAYVKYHQDIDMLEVAAVGIKTTRAAEVKNWEYLGDRFFINRDKTIVNQNGNTSDRFYLYEYHTAWSGYTLLGMLFRLNHNDNVVNEFKKFIGANYFTIGNGRCIDIVNLYDMQKWYKTSQKARGKGKEQLLTDTLTTKPLGDITGLAEKYPVKVLEERPYYKREIRHIMYFERLDDGWSVLRQLNRDADNRLYEVSRIYINDNGKNRIVAPTKEGWVPAKQVKQRWGTYSQLINADEAMEKCPRIKYTLNALSFVDEEKLTDALIVAMRFPEIEQFLKLGYREAANCMLNTNTPKADIKMFFGDYYNDKETSILRKVGLTKHQLDYFMGKAKEDSSSYSRRSTNALRTMRNMFGDDLSYMDYESFKRYFKGFMNIVSTFWRSIDYYINTLSLDAQRFVKNLIRLGEKQDDMYRIMHDAINAYSNLNYGTAPEVDWYFDDCSDVVRLHDAVVALKNEQDSERRARWSMAEAERRKMEEEKRIKIDKERKCYEYEDDEYIIRLPNDGAEIVSEGSIQKICIGGYVSRHSTGGTNLFFLRRKSEPESPFYAIEMSNDKRIVQIHGLCNRWLGCNPEAIPTVVRWLRKNGIHCDQTILTCKATGYGRVNDYVPMPHVD